MTDHHEALRAEIEAQTACIPWAELQRFFAGGKTLFVVPGIDLVEVASHIAQDHASAVAQLLEEQKVSAVSDQQATEWLQQGAQMRAVVLKPWVLVQPVS